MTGATAYDLCIAAANKWHRVQTNATKIGNKRMAGRAERQMRRAQHAAEQWLAHPALQATVTPTGGGFIAHDGNGRLRVRGTDLRAVQRELVEHGIRNIDISACGAHNFGD